MAKHHQTQQTSKTATTSTTSVSDVANTTLDPAAAPVPEAPAVEETGTQDVSDTTNDIVNSDTQELNDAAATDVTEEQTEQPTDEFDAAVAKIRTTGSASQIALINALETYIEPMRPKVPVDVHKGAQYQYGLWKAIESVLEINSAEEFTKLWHLLLAYFNKYKDGVFSERFVYRFSEFWHWPEVELKAFQRLINVILLTSDPAKRAEGLKHVSLERTLSEGFSETARQRLIGFYQR